MAVEIASATDASGDRRNGNGLNAKMLASSLQAECVIFEILQIGNFSC